MHNYFKPKKIKEIIGHENILGINGPIFKMLKEEKYYSFILFGDPGIGKTTIINALAYESKLKYYQLNGSNLTTLELKKILSELLENKGQTIILLIDEIHRLNQEKQTLLLTLLDLHNALLFATTTENPYIFVQPSIRSRVLIFEINKNGDDIVEGLYKNIKNMNLKQDYSKEQIKLIAKHRQYDVRSSINLLKFIDDMYESSEINGDLLEKISILKDYDAFQTNSKIYDLKSAFQKSIRGSDVDASLFYLGALIKNKAFDILLRRIPIIVYEDIGLANPNLCSRVCLAINECKNIGLPESKYILSNLVIEMCLSPKSNSAANAINKVLDYLENNVNYEIPANIKDNNYNSHPNLTNNLYKYPHNYKNHYVEQRYLPKNINELFYNYDYSNEYENKLNLNFNKWTKKE